MLVVGKGVFAGSLRLIHCNVGISEKLVWLGGSLLGGGDAKACADGDRSTAIDVERWCQNLSNSFDEFVCAIVRRRALDAHTEFVAAQPRQRVAGAQDAPNAICHLG